MIEGKVMYGPILGAGFGKPDEIYITDQGFTFTGKAQPAGGIRNVAVTLDVPFNEILDWKMVMGNYNISVKGYLIIFATKNKKDNPAMEYLYEQYSAIRNKRLNEEHHLRCNVCGKVFIYTLAEDVRLGRELMDAQKKSLRASMNTLLTSQLLGSIQEGQAQASEQAIMEKVRDLRRCPNCKSNNVTEISAEEAAAAAQAAAAPAAAPAPAVSAMDELKKLKELLDMGIVTQEEFDAKKKQLLGL